MRPFNLSIPFNEQTLIITVSKINGVYQLTNNGKIIGALRPPGEDWQLLTMEEILLALPVYEADLSNQDEIDLILNDLLIIQISGKIENHIGTLPL